VVTLLQPFAMVMVDWCGGKSYGAATWLEISMLWDCDVDNVQNSDFVRVSGCWCLMNLNTLSFTVSTC
jgi:hypothetical protein